MSEKNVTFRNLGGLHVTAGGRKVRHGETFEASGDEAEKAESMAKFERVSGPTEDGGADVSESDEGEDEKVAGEITPEDESEEGEQEPDEDEGGGEPGDEGDESAEGEQEPDVDQYHTGRGWYLLPGREKKIQGRDEALRVLTGG